jgi:hypothetical protein
MVADRRFPITIRLEPPFDDPRLFANPYFLPVVSAALDDRFVLGALGFNGIVFSSKEPRLPSRTAHGAVCIAFWAVAVEQFPPFHHVPLGGHISR